MKISKNSNNKAGTNKSQGNWNFTKCSKILAKFSFTGCTTKHTDLKWNNLFQTRRKHHELLSLPTATLEKYPHLYGHRVSNRVRYKVKFWKQSKPARYSQANILTSLRRMLKNVYDSNVCIYIKFKLQL